MIGLKGDLINGAYSRGRISGLTKQPGKEDLKLALTRLENMCEEYKERNICVNYNFEDTPDLNSLHNIDRKYWDAIELNLCDRLLADFGKIPIPTLATQITAGFSFLSASTAPRRETQYPSRQPIGSGNSLKHARYRNFYNKVAEVPLNCESTTMMVGDVEDFIEHFDSYLEDGEVISSYVLTNDDGLTVTNETNDTPDITYTVEAVGGSGVDKSASLQQIKIVVTTDGNRVTTRIINFELIDIEVG